MTKPIQSSTGGDALRELQSKWEHIAEHGEGTPVTDSFNFRCAMERCAAELGLALAPRTRLKTGDGDYSCAICGMGMKKPCEHWKAMLNRAEAPPLIKPEAPQIHDLLNDLDQKSAQYHKTGDENDMRAYHLARLDICNLIKQGEEPEYSTCPDCQDEPDPMTYPKAFQELGAKLADLLDDDQFNNIEPKLHELAKLASKQEVVAPVGEEMSERENFEKWFLEECVGKIHGGMIVWAKDAAWLAWQKASVSGPSETAQQTFQAKVVDGADYTSKKSDRGRPLLDAAQIWLDGQFKPGDSVSVIVALAQSAAGTKPNPSLPLPEDDEGVRR